RERGRDEPNVACARRFRQDETESPCRQLHPPADRRPCRLIASRDRGAGRACIRPAAGRGARAIVMHWNIVRPISAIAGYAALCFLAIGPDGASAADLLKARLAQNLGPISGLAIVAKSKGIFEKHGLDITVSNFTSGKQCLDTVIGGGADIATTAEAPVTASAMANQPIAFIAGMEYSDLKTVVAAKAGVKTKAD